LIFVFLEELSRIRVSCFDAAFEEIEMGETRASAELSVVGRDDTIDEGCEALSTQPLFFFKAEIRLEARSIDQTKVDGLFGDSFGFLHHQFCFFSWIRDETSEEKERRESRERDSREIQERERFKRDSRDSRERERKELRPGGG